MKAKLTKVNTKQEVMEILRKNLDNFALLGVSQVGLFGSFVREEATDKSDVDLLVSIDAPNSSIYYENYFKLLDFANSLFEGRNVDLVTENSINEINGLNICREVEYVDRV